MVLSKEDIKALNIIRTNKMLIDISLVKDRYRLSKEEKRYLEKQYLAYSEMERELVYGSLRQD